MTVASWPSKFHQGKPDVATVAVHDILQSVNSSTSSIFFMRHC